MNNPTKTQLKREPGDLVLREVWLAKDTLSAAYGHDLDKLFEQMSQREKLSGHPLVSLEGLRINPKADQE
jgi:hypothetical protein